LTEQASGVGPPAERSLAGRTALVTGASRGIGAAIAEALGAAGARAALLARSEDALNELAKRIGGGSFAVRCDVADPDSVAAATASLRAAFAGPPDIVVSNAGIFQIVSLEELTSAEFAATVQTNLVGPFGFLSGFLPEMKERGSGHVVTIGSIADHVIFPGNGAYSATKFAARALHEVLRAEMRGTGVRATLISPAAVDTDLWEPIRFLGSEPAPDRRAMLAAEAVAAAVIYAVTQPADVNVDELRLSRA